MVQPGLEGAFTVRTKNTSTTPMRHTAYFAALQDMAVAFIVRTASMSTALAASAGIVGLLAMEVAFTVPRRSMSMSIETFYGPSIRWSYPGADSGSSALSLDCKNVC